MNAGMDFSKSDLSALLSLQKKSPKAFRLGQEKASLQLLTWMNNGSPQSSRKPPIRFGVLRGSSSVFVGNKKVGDAVIQVKAEAKEQISPASAHSAPTNTSTIVYNTDYAAKMHEWDGGWGEFTIQDGDAGNKWIEDHLKADKDLFVKMIGIEVRKDLGL